MQGSHDSQGRHRFKKLVGFCSHVASARFGCSRSICRSLHHRDPGSSGKKQARLMQYGDENNLIIEMTYSLQCLSPRIAALLLRGATRATRDVGIVGRFLVRHVGDRGCSRASAEEVVVC